MLSRLYSFVTKNPLKIVILSTLILIVIVIFSIYYLESYKKPSSTTLNAIQLKNYDEIRQKIGVVLNDPKYSLNPNDKNRIISRLNILENKKSKPEEAYLATKEIALFLSSAYSDTNNPKYRELAQEVGDFAKINFAKQYNKNNFDLACQDSTCAENPQPQEILEIISDINNSDFPEYIKMSLTKDILNVGYLPDSLRQDKAQIYLILIDDIVSYNSLSTSGAGERIHLKFSEYIQKEYPDELEQFKKKIETYEEKTTK